MKLLNNMKKHFSKVCSQENQLIKWLINFNRQKNKNSLINFFQKTNRKKFKMSKKRKEDKNMPKK